MPHSGEALETHSRAALRTGRGLLERRKVRTPTHRGRACSGGFLISISKEPLRLLLAVPADDNTVAFMRLKRAVDAVDETLPDSGRVEQILPNVAERKRRLKEQVHIRDVDAKLLPNVQECIVPSSRLTVTCSPSM